MDGLDKELLLLPAFFAPLDLLLEAGILGLEDVVARLFDAFAVLEFFLLDFGLYFFHIVFHLLLLLLVLFPY